MTKSKQNLRTTIISLSLLTGLTLAFATPLATAEAAGLIGGNSKIKVSDQSTCSTASPKHVRCLAIRRNIFVNGVRQHALTPLVGTAFGANALRRAYSVTSVGARYKVIAIVDAMHSASAFDDVNSYRKMYALPALTNCGVDGQTTNSLPSGKDSCFIQENQDGVVDNSTETTDTGWAQEIALDLEMASAICPHCSILLVEAKSTNFSDLNLAVETAAAFQGVTAISNSYGGSDVSESKQPAYAAAAAAGIAVVASSGDSGYGVSSPASFSSVVGVGGTTLNTDGGYRWTGEAAWPKGGSGCSQLNPAPAWQDPAVTGCAGKSVVDVAAVADPASGVAVHFEGQWYTFGGTSAAAPIVAALFGMKANFGDSAGAFLWQNRGLLHDVTSGTNGRCLTALFCNAAIGFDGPTGWGSPSGTGAF